VNGCVAEQPSALSGAAASGTTAGAGGGGGAVENAGEALFRDLEQDFFDACGACHDAGGTAGTPFLAGPDRYVSTLSWPGIVVKDPAASLLLTHPIAGGGHLGVNIDSDGLASTLLPKVEAWLAEEAKGIAEPPPDVGPSIEPVTPILGFNAIYLDALGDELLGMAITFTAEELGDSSLLLREIEVHPTAKLGLHLVHPLFVVYPKGAGPDPDPIDSFSNVDQTFPAGAAGALGPGTLVLSNWQSLAKISIAFEVIEVKSADDPGEGGGGAGATGGCKAPDAFAESAAPALDPCFGCHGGSNGAATGAVDMSDLKSDPGSACAQVRTRVSTGDPPSSQIFITTDPDGNAAHPFKFGGSDQDFDDFKDALSAWIEAEK
jgi:cytochrome c553